MCYPKSDCGAVQQGLLSAREGQAIPSEGNKIQMALLILEFSPEAALALPTPKYKSRAPWQGRRHQHKVDISHPNLRQPPESITLKQTFPVKHIPEHPSSAFLQGFLVFFLVFQAGKGTEGRAQRPSAGLSLLQPGMGGQSQAAPEPQLGFPVGNGKI